MPGEWRGGTPDVPLKASAPAPERQTPVNMSQTSILFVARCLFLVIRARQRDPAAGTIRRELRHAWVVGLCFDWS